MLNKSSKGLLTTNIPLIIETVLLLATSYYILPTNLRHIFQLYCYSSLMCEQGIQKYFIELHKLKSKKCYNLL